MYQHLTQKDFWTEAIVFISKDENLNKAHIKYLENRLFDIAKSVNRYQIDNYSIPTQSSIAESDRAEMEEFLENIKILINTLGHKVFEVKREIKTIERELQETFYIRAVRGANAKGEPTSDGFVVFKGSKVAISPVPSFKNFLRLRAELIENDIIIKNGEYFEFSEDYVFSSPSTAAAIVMGRNANGLSEWRLKDGTSLKDFESEKNSHIL